MSRPPDQIMESSSLQSPRARHSGLGMAYFGQFHFVTASWRLARLPLSLHCAQSVRQGHFDFHVVTPPVDRKGDVAPVPSPVPCHPPFVQRRQSLEHMSFLLPLLIGNFRQFRCHHLDEFGLKVQVWRRDRCWFPAVCHRSSVRLAVCTSVVMTGLSLFMRMVRYVAPSSARPRRNS